MPVAPGLPTARIPRLNAFRAGTWNGIPFTADEVNQVVEAYTALSTGTPPEIQPIAVLGHSDDQPFLVAEGLPNVGRVTDVYAEGDRLYLDIEDSPAAFAQAVNSRRYSAVSVEFKQDYEDSTGKTWPWVLSRVAFLGAELPAVKGLEPVPLAHFKADDHPSDKVKVFTFAEAPMTRELILAALVAAGQDVSQVTADVPDQVLAAWLACATNGGKPNTPGMPGVPGGGPAYATRPPTPVVPKMAEDTTTKKDDDKDKDMAEDKDKNVDAKMTAKFSEAVSAAVAAAVKPLNDRITTLTATVGQVQKFAETTQGDRKKERATAAVEEAARAGKLFPAAKAPTLARLLRADSVVCFAEGEHAGKSEFDLQLAELSALPVVQKFKETMRDPIQGQGQTGINEELRTRMLSATPDGKAILGKEQAAARLALAAAK